MASQAYRRDDYPPPSGPKYRLFRLKAGERINFSLIGTRIYGYWTHWSGRTDPCIEPKEECQGCKRQDPQRWKGYVFCQRDDNGELGFLELTPLGKKKVLDLLGGERHLRGGRIKVMRGAGDKSALSYMLLRHWFAEFEGVSIPEDVHPEDTLRILFEWRRPGRQDRPKNGEGDANGKA